MSFVASVIGLVGGVGGGLLAANSAEKQQNKALGFQQNGVNELLRLRDSQANNPIMQFLTNLVTNRVQHPHTLDDRTIEIAKAGNASDATQAYGNNVRGIGARYGASGAGRSGAARGAINRAGVNLGSQIASGNRQIDLQASQRNAQDEAGAFELARQFFGLQQQPTRDIANAFSGTAALANSQPSPWAGFWQNSGQAVAGGAAGYLQQQQQDAQRTQQQSQWDQLMRLFGGGGGSSFSGPNYSGNYSTNGP